MGPKKSKKPKLKEYTILASGEILFRLRARNKKEAKNKATRMLKVLEGRVE